MTGSAGGSGAALDATVQVESDPGRAIQVLQARVEAIWALCSQRRDDPLAGQILDIIDGKAST